MCLCDAGDVHLIISPLRSSAFEPLDGAAEKLDMDDSRSSLIDSGSIPSCEAESNSSVQSPLKRTGTQWTAVAHIITGVIGAGVLSLAWSVAQLGWLLGPVCILAFAPIVLVSSFLVCDCYKYPDPINGTIRNRSYMEAVNFYLGEKHKCVSGLFLYEGFYGNGIAYTITAAASVRAILKSNCYHKKGLDASCEYGDSLYMLLFGLLQIVVSQIPDFHNMEWLSVISAAMSFTYSFIGAGLGLAKVIENGTIKGSITGVASSSSSVASKVWLAFEALGDIAFSYPKPVIVLEIQDTLRSHPPENQTMKRASSISIAIAAFFYLCCGCFGYAAFGDQTPGNLLTGFGFYEPYWLVDFANACIVLHLVGGYQIYSQPVFATVERWFREKQPNSQFLSNHYSLKLPLLGAAVFRVNLFRLCFRTTYVISTTAIAVMFPYFNSVLGVLGSLNFWPIAFYFPLEMYFVQKKSRAWSREWILLRGLSLFCLLISAAGFVGSLEKIINAKFGSGRTQFSL